MSEVNEHEAQETTPTLVEEPVAEAPESVPLGEDELQEFLETVSKTAPAEDPFLPDVVLLFNRDDHTAERVYRCEKHGLPLLFQAVCPKTFRVDGYHRLSANMKSAPGFHAHLACRCSHLNNSVVMKGIQEVIRDIESESGK